MTADAVLTMIVQGGSFALLAWVVYYAATKTLPERDKRFTEAIEKQRLDFISELKTGREHDQRRTEKLFALHAETNKRIDEIDEKIESHIVATSVAGYSLSGGKGHKKKED